ncbi:MAG: protein kinase [Candidatus Krumholzibacteriota bacterium]|nr:protein kinase [Candidatus Krumholzibacteriota bacterium]
MSSRENLKVRKFNLEPGFVIAGKYEVVEKLGFGWEGEVYRVRERTMGVDRAAKLFYPHRNDRNSASRFYGRKLHKLRHCPIVIHYHTQERFLYDGVPVVVLVSEFVEGELLNKYLKRQPGKKLPPFEALHLLYELAQGVEYIHGLKEYHGDLHDDNIIVRRLGISFNVKIVDMFNWGAPTKENIQEDVLDLIRIFYDSLGGANAYHRHPPEIKDICCGLKKSLIRRKFRNAGQLRRHITMMEW